MRVDRFILYSRRSRKSRKMSSRQHIVLLAICLFLHHTPVRSQALKEVEFTFASAAAPSSIWKPSLIFYVVPLFILALVMNKTISGNIRMIYDQ
ncbi:unnamed protein product [Cylicocyclus nassatus]|uniref:Uncharacterized protein n=1 Tax=Cylicocyclus nassatus TaxID=53992 RepID=A0AA36GHE4_CYLNA|nr:unnamed protein product [Cylicocyclus nassatus]